MGNAAKKPVPQLPEPPALPGTPADLEKLNASCAVHLPGSAAYDHHRVDKSWFMDPVSFGRPSAIAVPRSAEAVLDILSYCASTGCKFSVACGRHTPLSVQQGMLLIDLTHGMDHVLVDTSTKTITVGGGAKIGAVDAACKPHGYILPLGRVDSTGCVGQMLYTGAHGYCERAFGLGVDYLTSATVVLQTRVVKCSESEEPELFWAIRGGQSNFGIVCEMTFRAFEAPNNGQFWARQRVYLPTNMLGMPSRQTCMDYIVTRMDTSQPQEIGFSATVVVGGPVIASDFWFGANPQDGKAYLKSAPKHPGIAVVDNGGVHDYWTEIQQWAKGPKGENVGPGAWYFRGVMCGAFSLDMGRAIVAAVETPFPKGVQGAIIIDLMGGGRSTAVPTSSMALATRPNVWIIITAGWEPTVTGPEGRDFCLKWCRDLWKTLLELSIKQTKGQEQVFLDTHTGETQDMLDQTMLMGQQAKIKAIWGDNLPRLLAAKAQYDPSNFFGSNLM